MTEPKAAKAPSLSPADLIAELQKGEAKKGEIVLTRAGAGLALAHMLVDLGEAKVRQTTGAQAREYVAAFLRRVPMASSALAMGIPQRFVKVCGMYRVTCDTVENYQEAVSRLAPPPKVETNVPQARAAAE